MKWWRLDMLVSIFYCFWLLVFGKTQGYTSIASPYSSAPCNFSCFLNWKFILRARVSPVSWGCKIHQLHLCRGSKTTPSLQWVSWYAIKQSDGEALVILELWGMLSTPSLLLLPGPLWPRVVAPDRILSMSQIDLFDI